MLETKNLRKVYKTKKGVSVEALKGISLKFPETGMVFLLGKSGSGKSTLLNLLGGLDQYDEGEIIIKGVSSKNFKQSHFDSYRNTYVGFIFQEYNVLEEFTVGANIALAIELQGRKADDAEIQSILKQVDLEGFGDRKPNELSGGQKQRVAIARALVKNPQIIMADEPTGALDSNTGKQVLEALKKLSEKKLVIVVSHDREFAETYGDRIIELADGNVIRDVERCNVQESAGADQNGEAAARQEAGENQDGESITRQEPDKSDGIVFEGDTMLIPAGYHLSEKDREQINEYICSLQTGLKGKIRKKGKGVFRDTDQSRIAETAGDFRLIQSKLPMKNSFKIGAGGLKHKKIRLAFTIILSFVAFSLFALADTFGNYNHVKTCTKSIVDSDIQYASVIKSVKQDYGDGDYYWDDWNYRLDQEQIDTISQDTGLDFRGVYVPEMEIPMNNYSLNVSLTENENEETSLYAKSFSGFAEITNKDLKEMGYQLLTGRMPKGERDEIAISEYVYKTYEKAGYIDEKSPEQTYSIKSYQDMIGKKLTILEKEYTVTGIVDTNVDMKRYQSVSEAGVTKTSAERLTTYALSEELNSIKSYSLSCVVMMGEGRVQKMIAEKPQYLQMDHFYMSLYDENSYVGAQSIAKLSDVDTSKITWVDGERKKLGAKEIVVTSYDFCVKDKELKFDDIMEYLKGNSSYMMDWYQDNKPEDMSETGWKIVGVINTDEKNDDLAGVYVLPDEFYEKGWDEEQGDYAYAVASMPDTEKDISSLVKYCYTERGNVRYCMQNQVTFELDSVNDVLKILSKVFLYIGIGFAVFAALMLSNFIATSISYKKQEIGILRAIGARSNDVFRIFFSESFIIAMINFVLACIATGAATAVINWVIRHNAGILITVLNFGFRQILLLWVISIAVAAVASFIPVYKIASKKPIEAIRNI